MSLDAHIPTHPTAPAGVRDHMAIVLMLGAVLLVLLPLGLLWAVVAWTIGAALLWASRAWTPGEKVLGTLVWPGGLIGPTVLVSSVTQVCTYVSGDGGATAEVVSEPVCTGFALSPWVGVPFAVLAFGAPIVVGVVLVGRANSR